MYLIDWLGFHCGSNLLHTGERVWFTCILHVNVSDILLWKYYYAVHSFLYSDLVLRSACHYLFCPAYSEQVEQFLIPAMVYSKFPFPFVELIQSLIQQTSPTPNSSNTPTKKSLIVTPSPWLLGSIIAFADKNIGKYRLRYIREKGTIQCVPKNLL